MCDPLGNLFGNIYDDLKALSCWAADGIDYAKKLKENEGKLMDEVSKLGARRDDIEENLKKDERASSECKNWIRRAKNVEEEAKQLKGKYNKKRQQSCRWLHCWSRSKLSQDMEKKSTEVENIFREGEHWRKGNDVGRSQEPTRRTHPPNLEGKPSFHTVAEEKLISFLRDEKIRRIGVWGIMGSGKTTIMNNMMRNESITCMFKTVILVTVSENWNEKELQDEIMGQLNLNMEGSADIVENAGRISRELETKKCLILLDSFEKKIDLDQTVGIRSNQKGSKIVLASRFCDICIDMKADELIKVEYLSPDDAWMMFKETVGDVIDQFPRIEEIARLVVQECGRLPLLIDTVASNCRKNGNDVTHWRNFLNALRTWKNLQGLQEVFQSLECCYDGLDDDRRKNCFLYSALYPAEGKIYVDHLLECWISQGFIDETHCFRNARDAGHLILDDLINVSFLVRTENRKVVRMNRLLRNMALKISSQNNHLKILVKPAERSQDFPQIEEWHEADHISLMGSNLPSLPETLDCVNLETLFLQKNKELLGIPKMFFKSMCSLQVLDLHAIGIASLPYSLSQLSSLKALYLNSCSNLKNLPCKVKALKRLALLDIRGTKLALHQIGSSISLRCLRVSFSNFSTGNHTTGSVSGFSSLEEFTIDVDSSQPWLDDIAEVVTKEVATLKNLTSLQFFFHRLECLDMFVKTSPVWKENYLNSSFTFQFCVGCPDFASSQILESVDYPSSNSLKLVNTEGNHSVISTVLKETDIFGLVKHKGVSGLSDFDINNLENMLVCLIEGCDDIKVVIDGDRITGAVLTHLKDLYIKNVEKLESIWLGQVPHGSLAQLTTLILSNCPELKKIFSEGLIQQLHGLQHLKVEECHQIEEIIMKSESPQLGGKALPRLTNLELIDLPELRSILDDSIKWDWPSLYTIKISLCAKLKCLPFNNENAFNLRHIEGQQSWWDELQWKDEAYQPRLKDFFHPQ